MVLLERLLCVHARNDARRAAWPSLAIG